MTLLHYSNRQSLYLELPLIIIIVINWLFSFSYEAIHTLYMSGWLWRLSCKL